MVNLKTKFEFSKFTHYEDMKGNVNVETIGLVVWGLGSSKVTGTCRTHTTSYSTLIETMRLSSTVYEL